MLSDPDFRELVTLPLPTNVLRMLSKTGYTNIGEVRGLTTDQVASVCQLTHTKAASVLNIVNTYARLSKTGANIESSGDLFHPHSALEMLQLEGQCEDGAKNLLGANHVLTMSKSFDDLLGGGFPCGRITEVCGQPGIGKTQFCMQSCLTVQLPTWCGGMQGEAVFLDTEGSFMPKRLLQMAKELVTHCKKRIEPRLLQHIRQLGPEEEEERRNCEEVLTNQIPTVESLLSRVNYIRCTDYLQLLAAVRRLHEFCRYHPDIRLLIVDSIALPFRYEFEDIPQRNRLLAALSQSLLSIAGAQNAAVIVTNQITTRFRPNDFITASADCNNQPPISDGQLVPALGDSWGHICSVRLLLKRSLNGRIAQLLKHPGQPPGSANYQVTVAGIRDVF